MLGMRNINGPRLGLLLIVLSVPCAPAAAGGSSVESSPYIVAPQAAQALASPTCIGGSAAGACPDPCHGTARGVGYAGACFALPQPVELFVLVSVDDFSGLAVPVALSFNDGSQDIQGASLEFCAGPSPAVIEVPYGAKNLEVLVEDALAPTSCQLQPAMGTAGVITADWQS
jgi:hypothetical protein